MTKVFPGRYTAQIEGPFVVFLIGLRINRVLAFGKWIPVAKAMPRMLSELYGNMPRWGLATAGEHVPAIGRLSGAKERMSGG